MKFSILVIALTLFFVAVSASVVEVEVKMKLNGKISVYSLEKMNNTVKAIVEFYNTGSVPYTARARFDILNESDLIFSGWSEEKPLMPGERKVFELYWISQTKVKDLEARARVYFGNEIVEESRILKINYVTPSKDIFQIKNFRVYDDYIRFEVRANETLKNVIIVPSDYIHGWIFEQTKLEELKANKNTEVKIRYVPTVWREDQVKINVFTENGSYYSSEIFKLRKEEGLLKYFHMIFDKLSLLLNL